MANPIKVIGRLMHPNSGLPWEGATIEAVFCGYTQTATEQRPSDRFTTTSNAEGIWELDLWPNDLGDYASHYLFNFPNARNLKIFVPSNVATIEFSAAKLLATPESDPAYSALLELVLGLGGGQSAAKIHTQLTASETWTFNHNSGIRQNASLYNLAWELMISEISQPNANQAIATFSQPTTGYLVLS